MKRAQRLGVLAYAACIGMIAAAVAGCSKKPEPAPETPAPAASPAPAPTTTPAPATTATPSSDSAAAPAGDAVVKTYTFHATPTAIDEQATAVTMKHEAIEGYAAAGTTTFTAADPAILKQVAVGKETHVTLRVAGALALIVKVQTGHDKGHEH